MPLYTPQGVLTENPNQHFLQIVKQGMECAIHSQCQSKTKPVPLQLQASTIAKCTYIHLPRDIGTYHTHRSLTAPQKRHTAMSALDVSVNRMSPELGAMARSQTQESASTPTSRAVVPLRVPRPHAPFPRSDHDNKVANLFGNHMSKSAQPPQLLGPLYVGAGEGGIQPGVSRRGGAMSHGEGPDRVSGGEALGGGQMCQGHGGLLAVGLEAAGFLPWAPAPAS